MIAYTNSVSTYSIFTAYIFKLTITILSRITTIVKVLKLNHFSITALAIPFCREIRDFLAIWALVVGPGDS